MPNLFGEAMEQPKPVPSHWKQERDWAYSERVYQKLARKYPNRWIAVAHHRVIASGTNVMKVLAQAHRKVEWQEIPLVFVERGIHVYYQTERPYRSTRARRASSLRNA